ncbi:MAG: hypothetical protein Q9163_003583 [Psora crenata]
MASALQNTPLRGMAPHELALYLRRACAANSVTVITDHLLQAIEQESLPPQVYNIWLTVSGSFEPTCVAIHQPFSNYLRSKGITQLGRALKSDAWKDIWDELGGIEGTLSLLAKLSVHEVGQLCNTIGGCARPPEINDLERRQHVTALLKALLPDVYETPFKTLDRRPLHKHYAQIVPACTFEFVDALLQSRSHPLTEYLPPERVAQNHYPVLRRLILSVTDRLPSMDPNDPVFRRLLRTFLPLLIEKVPSLPGEEPGFSAPMSFAKAILYRLANSDDAYKTFQPFNEYLERRLVKSFIRRIVKSAASQAQILEVVRLVTAFLKRHDIQVEWHKRSLTFYVAKFWSSSPTVFEDDLKILLSLQRYVYGSRSIQLHEHLRNISKPCRYRFLRLSILHMEDLRYDIDEDTGLAAFIKKVKQLHTDIFLLLHKDHSVPLLERLMEVQPDGTFLRQASGTSILSHSLTPLGGTGDPHLLLALLTHKPPSSAQVYDVTQLVRAQQSKATKSRDQSHRAFFARSAAFYAIASGSLEVYEDVTVWMRRYLRDPLTVMAIYSMHAINTKEGVALLSGFVQDTGGNGPDHVRLRVVQANKIIFHHLQAAILSLREPSFDRDDWRGPLRLFEDVVAARDSQATLLQREHNLGSEEVCAILYTDIIQTILKAEELVTQPGYEGLGFEEPASRSFFVMGHWSGRSPSTQLFLDRLAKARDDLWKDIRRLRNPAASVLAEPWPRGLPLQFLPCLHNDRHLPHGSMPYINARASAIVFVPAEVALAPSPSQEEVAQAIGKFVDDYRTALKVYVYHGHDPEAQEARALQALTHALGPLSSGRMSEEEAYRFWKPIFAEALPTCKLPWKQPKVAYPLLPTDVDPLQPSEWNPNAAKPPDSEFRKLSSTVLDCMLHASGPYQDSSGKIEAPTSSVPGVSYPRIFSYEMLMDVRNKNFAEKEGIVAAFLLDRSLKVGNIARPLRKPFPSEDDVRYPALFLDGEYLATSERSKAFDDEIIQKLIIMVPSELIAVMSAEATAELNSSTPAPERRAIYTLLKLFAACDRPHLAIDLILEVIMQHSEDSSWHRQLFTRRLCHSLPAREVERAILGFTEVILERLQLQSSTKAVSKDGGQTAGSDQKVAIKVTTIKLLTRLLNNADVISPNKCIAILGELLEASTHIDVKVKVVESLLVRLVGCKNDDTIAEAIFAALKAVVPVAGSLNETLSIGEQKWPEKDCRDSLPEVYHESVRPNNLPPLLHTLQIYLNESLLPSPEARRNLVRRVMLPIVETSIANNARWVYKFLAMHPAGSTVKELPMVPHQPEIVSTLLLTSSDVIPSWLLDRYHQWVLTNMSPPQAISRLNEEIRNSFSLRNSNGGKHWLSLYGRGQTVDLCIPNLLKVDLQPPAILQHVQDLVHQQAETLLYLCDQSFTRWDAFMNGLRPKMLPNSDKKCIAWLSCTRPVVERIIEMIDKLRSPSWQRDPDRRPCVLPETFRYRLWVMDYTIYYLTSPQEDRFKRFGMQLMEKLDEVFSLGIAHHEKLGEIKAAALMCPKPDYEIIACSLARLPDMKLLDGDSATLQKVLLRVDLAEALFTQGLLPSRQKNVTKDAIEIIRSWRQSEVEEIRMSGLRIGKAILERYENLDMKAPEF